MRLWFHTRQYSIFNPMIVVAMQYHRILFKKLNAYHSRYSSLMSSYLRFEGSHQPSISRVFTWTKALLVLLLLGIVALHHRLAMDALNGRQPVLGHEELREVLRCGISKCLFVNWPELERAPHSPPFLRDVHIHNVILVYVWWICFNYIVLHWFLAEAWPFCHFLEILWIKPVPSRNWRSPPVRFKIQGVEGSVGGWDDGLFFFRGMGSARVSGTCQGQPKNHVQ